MSYNVKLHKIITRRWL